MDLERDAEKTFRLKNNKKPTQKYEYAMNDGDPHVEFSASSHLLSTVVEHSAVACERLAELPHLKNHSC